MQHQAPLVRWRPLVPLLRPWNDDTTQPLNGKAEGAAMQLRKRWRRCQSHCSSYNATVSRQLAAPTASLILEIYGGEDISTETHSTVSTGSDTQRKVDASVTNFTADFNRLLRCAGPYYRWAAIERQLNQSAIPTVVYPASHQTLLNHGSSTAWSC